MALHGMYIRVTNLTSSVLFLNDINQGFESLATAQRDHRAGPSYVPANSYVDLVLSSDVLLSYESGSIRKQVDAGHLSVSNAAGAVKTLTWRYDYASDGGAISTITLKDIQGVAQQLSNAVVLRGYIEVIDAVTSAGAATVAFGKTASADGFRAATAKATLAANAVLPFTGAFVHNTTPVYARVTTAVDITATIAVAVLTAGKFNVHLEVLPII